MAKSCLTLRPPWTAACQAFLSLTISWSLPKFMSITSSATLFTFCLQSFPASGSFVSWLFTSGDQNIGASASASVLPINIQGLFPLELTGLISLQSKGLLSLLQHHNSKASILQGSAFFMVQLSYLYMITGKTQL